MIATIKKISTAIDGGFTITFDVPENQKELVKELFDLNNEALTLEIKLLENNNHFEKPDVNSVRFEGISNG